MATDGAAGSPGFSSCQAGCGGVAKRLAAIQSAESAFLAPPRTEASRLVCIRSVTTRVCLQTPVVILEVPNGCVFLPQHLHYTPREVAPQAQRRRDKTADTSRKRSPRQAPIRLQ